MEPRPHISILRRRQTTSRANAERSCLSHRVPGPRGRTSCQRTPSHNRGFERAEPAVGFLIAGEDTKDSISAPLVSTRPDPEGHRHTSHRPGPGPGKGIGAYPSPRCGQLGPATPRPGAEGVAQHVRAERLAAVAVADQRPRIRSAQVLQQRLHPGAGLGVQGRSTVLAAQPALAPHAHAALAGREPDVGDLQGEDPGDAQARVVGPDGRWPGRRGLPRRPRPGPGGRSPGPFRRRTRGSRRLRGSARCAHKRPGFDGGEGPEVDGELIEDEDDCALRHSGGVGVRRKHCSRSVTDSSPGKQP